MSNNTEQYQDINLTCVCNSPFVWTRGEQLFINKLKDEGKIPSVQTPRRCLDCRAKKKAERKAAKEKEY